MRRDLWPNIPDMVEDYTVHRLSIKQIARKYRRGTWDVGGLFHELGITRPRSEAAKQGWNDERRAWQGRVNHVLQQGVTHPQRTVGRERRENVHDLAVWFQYTKERTGRYPNGAQVDNMIEQLRVWNGGEVKPQKRGVAV